ncbi:MULTISPECIES: hypothetical protein [Bacillus]|uniref:Uncharacterized protein n=1 Tax=Bacillus smithii 7_3_47FAA TaxID=665952 RepID=G9QPG7_9BACI|nr:hypothetical protein [Bacillus smithii]EHL73829.1 hypothetical protein HMPREF1015_00184 [Bacillus smithii 7_3_47FAA]
MIFFQTAVFYEENICGERGQQADEVETILAIPLLVDSFSNFIL